MGQTKELPAEGVPPGDGATGVAGPAVTAGVADESTGEIAVASGDGSVGVPVGGRAGDAEHPTMTSASTTEAAKPIGTRRPSALLRKIDCDAVMPRPLVWRPPLWPQLSRDPLPYGSVRSERERGGSQQMRWMDWQPPAVTVADVVRRRLRPVLAIRREEVPA